MSLRRTRTGEKKERGAVLVELTLVVPLLITIVLGMFEIGMAWSASQNVVQASRSGARTVSQLGTYPRADEEALRSVLSTFGDEPERVLRVTIYEYEDSTATGVPVVCSDATNCNNYLATDLAQVGVDDTYFAEDDRCTTVQKSRPWCPTERDDTQRTATLIGVEVEYTHTPVTGFFGVGDRIITQRLVMRVEPAA